MKRAVKQGLLRFGGYELARDIQLNFETRQLYKRVQKFKKTGMVPLPDMVMFEPTQRCNQRCKMCFQDRQVLEKNQELSSDQIVRFFEKNHYLKKITFIGGEIFLRRDMIDIISQLDETRDMVLCTNGTLLDRSSIEALKRCRRVYTICVSLEGPEEVHDSIRRVRGSFKKTTGAIAALADYFPITVNAVIQDENLHFLPELVRICKELGVKKVKLELERLFSEDDKSRAIGAVHLGKSDIPLVSSGRRRQYTSGELKMVLDASRSLGKKIGILVSYDPPFLVENVESCHSGSIRTIKRFVSQSFRTATIAPNGDVINCLTIRKPIGNILEESLEEIWNSDLANQFRRRLLKNNLTALCENCPFMKSI